jgi:isoquinoline 1-oxidoreductase beta subunit
MPHPYLDRRTFLKTSAVTGGGLLMTVALRGLSRWAAAEPTPPTLPPNAFIRIAPDGAVTLVMPCVEMGQGIYTSMAMMMAEELDVGLDQVQLETAPPDPRYVNPIIHEQITADSSSIRAFGTTVRLAGATTRALLISAAATHWGVAASSCTTARGTVVHQASRRTLSYGMLASAAATLPIPPHVPLKAAKDFTLIGKPVKRLDTPSKVNGTAQYGIDAKVPGMKFAAVAMSPVSGGTAAHYDKAAALAVNGVRQVVTLPGAIAVIADHTGAAQKGVRALAVRWNAGPNGDVTSAGILEQLRVASSTQGGVARKTGDVAAAFASAARRVDAIYEQPFVAHACMEPLNCTVHVRPDRCDVWIGTQAPGRVQAIAAKLTGLPLSAVAVHGHLLGGGFGRKSEIDYVAQAVTIAKAVDAPVKVIWTREQDIQHDMYRPYYYDRISAGLDPHGKPVAWSHRIVGSSFLGRLVPQALAGGFDPDAVDGAADLQYDVPNIVVDFVRQEPRGVMTTWWRSIGRGRNAFVIESFIDELAAATGTDPVAYRAALLSHEPRALGVLQLAASKAGWGQPLPPKHGRGVAVQPAFDSYFAQVVEVDVTDPQAIKVSRVVCAADCGLTINPDTVVAQMQGGIIFGLSAALYGLISLKHGAVEQGNFDTYRVLRMDEAPRIEVYLVESTAASGGIGEAGVPCAIPALANAIFAATGTRLRNLPLRLASGKLAST